MEQAGHAMSWKIETGEEAAGYIQDIINQNAAPYLTVYGDDDGDQRPGSFVAVTEQSARFLVTVRRLDFQGQPIGIDP